MAINSLSFPYSKISSLQLLRILKVFDYQELNIVLTNVEKKIFFSLDGLVLDIPCAILKSTKDYFDIKYSNLSCEKIGKMLDKAIMYCPEELEIISLQATSHFKIEILFDENVIVISYDSDFYTELSTTKIISKICREMR